MPDLTPAPVPSPAPVAVEPLVVDPFEAAPAAPRQRWRWPAGVALAAVVLFFVYLRIAVRHGFGADGAVLEQQAWDMLNGNPLMRGWTVADIAFYTIEIPELAVIEWFRGGLSPEVLSLAEALNLTLLVVLAALLAKGRATGRAGLMRALVAGGIVFAPVAGANSTLMLSNPDHLATQIFVLAAWLIIDRARPRWWVPAAVAALLGWARLSDSIVLLEAELPLLVVCAARIYRRGGALRDQWYELSLGGAAIAAELIAQVALTAVRALGGFTAYPLQETFAPVSQLSGHVWVTVESTLLLYGADFSGLPLQGNLALLTVAAHLIGAALAVAATVYALRRFAGNDLMPQIVTAMMVTSVLAYTLLGEGVTASGGAHDVLPALPAGAVLAGRMLAKSPVPRRLLAMLAAGLALYAGLLAVYAVQVQVAPDQTALAAWLQDHHLRFGLSNYYAAALTTVDGDNRVAIAPVKRAGDQLVVSPWESTTSWYDPARHDATFFVATPMNGCRPGDARLWAAAAVRAYGPPARTYAAGGDQILVWNHNLLDDRLPQVPMGRPSSC
ncbi:MAG TPA: hypothetical protein VHZ33_17840 [Trebonia sp.]|jgi:hypothetical protein|nr:hypothetical protein [Trebonia sp.]